MRNNGCCSSCAWLMALSAVCCMLCMVLAALP